MATEIMPIDAHMVASLRRAVKDCSDRSLSAASKWASELLLALPPSTRTGASAQASGSAPVPPPTTAPSETQQGTTGTTQPPDTEKANDKEQEAEDADADLFATARAYVDSKEFMRAVHTLKGCLSAKARFLRVYSQYMASEKRALRDWHKLDNNRHQPQTPINPSLRDLLDLVQNVTDPWLLFLKALFLSRLSRREEAIECILLSIRDYPWNWSAWSLLGSCIGDGEELSSLLPLLPLPPSHPLVHIFQIRTANEMHTPTDQEIGTCERLLSAEFFPGSVWLMAQRAGALYHSHAFRQAELQFQKILTLDPYRIDDIDIYSNILYVTENKTKLSKLAHEYLALDKDRPEVCCLVGNHYSLKLEHEKAVRYFKRATQLDRTYLSAWTLMGHEYVEMKNSHAAIEAYRRAVDVNRKDYRAWYGLGQAYELLNMHQFALHYYQRATALRPYDVRLWQAQGMCYEDLGRPREAVECLKRALLGADPHETVIKFKLAKLHDGLEEFGDAAAYHRRIVEICKAGQKPVLDYAKSSVYVARFHMHMGGGDLALAKEYLERVAHSNAEEVTLATELLKRVKGMIQIKTQAQEKPEGAAGVGQQVGVGAS